MPTYGYRCTVCKHEFERFQKITDPALTECESCGAPVKKILYPVGIAFKGSGFYVNDSKSGGGSKPKSASEKPAETPPGEKSSGDSSSSDSTPASETKSDSSASTAKDSATKDSPSEKSSGTSPSPSLK